VEQAISGSNTVEQVLLIDAPEVANDSRIIEWQKAKIDYATECPVEEMHAEDPLFILYTSGSTGKPKGIVHSSAGYILYAAMTHKYIFDYHDGDIYWCGADVGWITGHSYIVYGPLANGATTLMFAGTPTYPTAARFWQVIDKYKVNIFYTAPTAIRTLIKAGDDWVKQTDRSSLRLLGSVGEPINPEVWLWYHDVVGNKQCPVIDTWWQTETGGIMISPLPGAIPQKPGYAQTPFIGIEPVLLDDSGQATAQGKLLAIKQPWPGMARTIYNDHKRYQETYFKYGCYIPGDEALQDPNGDLRITGRMDDVLNVSGHRIGTAEIESAILEHSAVAEAAVVGMKHDIKGEAIYAFVTLKADQPETEEMKREITQVVRREIGAIATPEVIQWAAELPKTRSGKIMRRILKKIANRDTADLGDLSTLADPTVIQNLTSIPRG
jgi:acetyl-CoA synthetase